MQFTAFFNLLKMIANVLLGHYPVLPSLLSPRNARPDDSLSVKSIILLTFLPIFIFRESVNP